MGLVVLRTANRWDLAVHVPMVRGNNASCRTNSAAAARDKELAGSLQLLLQGHRLRWRNDKQQHRHINRRQLTVDLKSKRKLFPSFFEASVSNLAKFLR